ncbi:hypothetical protein [Streptomyces sp. NPDC007205]|uniref:hypothetical protein n=1 Tax=Streptomyces sp. NPDC007205 TaxID=3154316 RepID=UPI0033D1840C
MGWSGVEVRVLSHVEQSRSAPDGSTEVVVYAECAVPGPAAARTVRGVGCAPDAPQALRRARAGAVARAHRA